MSKAFVAGGAAPVPSGLPRSSLTEKKTGAMSPVERAFRTALLDAAQAVPEGLTDGTGRPAGRRYAVYRNNVAVSLKEALETGFPAVATLLGPTNFANIAGLYLRQAPPTNPLMMHYGAGFPQFLEGFPPVQHLGYLPDVARLELALRRSYHAADAAPLTAETLGTMDEAALMAARLPPVPAVQVLRSRWAVYSIWHYTLHGGAKPPSGGEDVLVARPGFDPAPQPLPAGGARFLAALAEGAAFSDAIAAAGEDLDLAAVLSLCLQTGALRAPQPMKAPQ